MGLNKINKKEILEIFKFNAKIKRHLLFKNMLEFIGLILSSFAAYLLTNKLLGKNNENFSMTSIQKKREVYLENKNSYNYFILFIVCFFISFSKIQSSIATTLQMENYFWVVELLSITIFSLLIFKSKIKNHHKVAILVIAPLIFTHIINAMIPMTHHKCKTEIECKRKYISDNGLYEMMKNKYGVYSFMVIGLTLFSIIMKDYSWIQSKYLMDIRGINVYIILLVTGVTGFILVIILFIISSYNPCDIVNVINVDFVNELYTDINNITYPMSKQICFVSEYNENENILKFYYDNFFLFFKDYNLKEDKFEIFFVMPLYFLLISIINICNIMMIRYLDPNYILINKNASYFLEKFIYYFFIIKCNEEYGTFSFFIIDEIQLLISIISNLIYIEVIELKFCELDYDLKKNIEIRCEKEKINEIKSIELTINHESFQDD
jgi:hypothetical protein